MHWSTRAPNSAGDNRQISNWGSSCAHSGTNGQKLRAALRSVQQLWKWRSNFSFQSIVASQSQPCGFGLGRSPLVGWGGSTGGGGATHGFPLGGGGGSTGRPQCT